MSYPWDQSRREIRRGVNCNFKRIFTSLSFLCGRFQDQAGARVGRWRKGFRSVWSVDSLPVLHIMVSSNRSCFTKQERGYFCGEFLFNQPYLLMTELGATLLLLGMGPKATDWDEGLAHGRWPPNWFIVWLKESVRPVWSQYKTALIRGWPLDRGKSSWSLTWYKLMSCCQAVHAF